jgi:hypothetical protein
MSLRIAALAAVLAWGGLPQAVSACGDSEAGLSCDDAGTGIEAGAKWLLTRASKAVVVDQAKALDAFTKGADGFQGRGSPAYDRLAPQPKPRME